MLKAAVNRKGVLQAWPHPHGRPQMTYKHVLQHKHIALDNTLRSYMVRQPS